MQTNTPAPEQVYGYEVQDSDGHKIGDVDGVWVDDATSALEFVGVKTGFIMGKTHLIPAENAEFSDKTLRIPYAKDKVHGAPSFATDAELSPDDESKIYEYYGVNRSTAPSPSGLADESQYQGRGYDESRGTTGTAEVATDRASIDTAGTDRQRQDMVLSEEELEVGKRQVEAGRVRLRKVVRTETVSEPIELRHEEIQIERVDATGTEVPAGAFQEQSIEVPVMREEPVVAKEAHTVGQVHIDKSVQTETRTIDGEVRREDVEIDRDGIDGGHVSDASHSTDGTHTAGQGLGDRIKNTVEGERNR
ncbi:MAG: hypothetical protein NVS4B2_11310 [Chloroflexota bacterium]